MAIVIHYFKPNDHIQHMVGMDAMNKSYLEHMMHVNVVAIDIVQIIITYKCPYLMDFEISQMASEMFSYEWSFKKFIITIVNY